MRPIDNWKGTIWSHFLSVFFLLLLAFLFFNVSISEYDKDLFYEGAFLVSFGVLFLFSYYYDKEVWLFSLVMYLSSVWSFPQKRWMAIVFGVVSLCLGIVRLFQWLSEK